MEVQHEIHKHMLALNVKHTDDFADLHKIHDHLLVLNDEHNEDGLEHLCDECRESILSPFYSCNRCQIFLHDECVETPKLERDLIHPLHLDHPLRSMPLNGEVCAACGKEIIGFGFACLMADCNFIVDEDCGLVGHKIKQQVVGRFHKHPLNSLQKRTSFLCDGCGKKHEDASFLCTACGFWVGRGCALLPKTVSRRDHRHPLKLVYSHQLRYSPFFKPNCKICNEEVNLWYWVYCCAFAKCRYFAHPYCAKTDDEVSRALELEVASEDPDPKPISLPWVGELRSVYAYFIEEIILQGRKQEVNEINHDSHKHPLILYDIQIDEESSLTRKWAKVSQKSDKVCDGCSEVILSPFYGCNKCNYVLHKWCAELPETIDSPCHLEHTLHRVSFPSQLPKETKGFFNCSACKAYCTGFFYVCRICKKKFDIKCVSLPGEITHKAHIHTHTSHCALQLRESYSIICRACGRHFSRSHAYACDTCDFILDIECVALPGQVWHRYDKEHPFILRYYPVEGTNEYFCEICEGEIDAKRKWFYHCTICDQSLHTECICPFDSYSNNVKVGSKVRCTSHYQHTLSVVGKPKSNYVCEDEFCGRIVELWEKAVECDECNVGFHVECVVTMGCTTLDLLQGRVLASDDE